MKVSVIVATYRSGPELDETVASLDRQTLPPDQFEVLLIDDGSPDDTLARLEHIAAARPNVRVIGLPHSGWPSRPRNHGIEAARGDYVLFLDHDDEIGDQMLAAASALGDRNNADAVNVKEARTRLAGWGLPIFDRDHDDALARIDHNPLGPMTPHKLYRRELLLEHGIRFPEGRRALWEDIFFNVDVLAVAQRISILSSVDGYHWRDTDVNSSKTFDRDPWEQWGVLREIFMHVRARLGHRPWLADSVHANFLASQIVPLLLDAPERFGDEAPAARAEIADVIHRTVSETALARLGAHHGLLLRLLLAGDPRAAALAALDEGTVATSRVTTPPVWRDGTLEVATQASWLHDTHPAPLLRVAAERVLRDVSGTALSDLSDADLDVTAELASAESTLSVRDRRTHAVWPQATVQTFHVHDHAREAGQSRLTATAVAHIDPAHARAGSPLAAGVWDVGAHNAFLWGHNHRRVAMDRSWSAATIVDGVPMRAFATRGGTLAIDVDQTDGALLQGLRLRRIAAAPHMLAVAGLVMTGDPVDVIVRRPRARLLSGRMGRVVWRIAAPLFRPRRATLAASDGDAILDLHRRRAPRRLIVQLGKRSATLAVGH